LTGRCLENLNVDAGLIVHLGREYFALARGNNGVALDHIGHDATCEGELRYWVNANEFELEQQ
jgi:hypothetical protein